MANSSIQIPTPHEIGFVHRDTVTAREAIAEIVDNFRNGKFRIRPKSFWLDAGVYKIIQDEFADAGWKFKSVPVGTQEDCEVHWDFSPAPLPTGGRD